ncbi:hypothetical protein KUTeg_022623 [Tegillarca granosa]|uniref:Uncharacterized protein n=1 Tax=Tegillarca granosa TaxID=220873 RepID=A0ABQ9DZA8_TEGGR|nr:hypothetical protein KUTeg_022623 [Tegillarca granosa]
MATFIPNTSYKFGDFLYLDVVLTYTTSHRSYNKFNSSHVSFFVASDTRSDLVFYRMLCHSVIG